MKIVSNNNVSFSGNSEILYNLGKAINKAQYAASGELSPKSSLARSEVGEEIASLRAYLDAATHDSKFETFINNFKSHLNTKTDSRPGGSRNKYTLKEIINETGYFEGKATEVKNNGFSIFKNEFINNFFEKFSNTSDKLTSNAYRFLKSLEPTYTLNDLGNLRSSTKIDK